MNTVTLSLCGECLTAKGSRMCETENCTFWHEILPATFVSRVVLLPVSGGQSPVPVVGNADLDRPASLPGDCSAGTPEAGSLPAAGFVNPLRPPQPVPGEGHAAGDGASLMYRDDNDKWWDIARGMMRRS
jgi:hypothetical protein